MDRYPFLATLDAYRMAQAAYEVLFDTLPIEMHSLSAGLDPVIFTMLDGTEVRGFGLASAKLAEITDREANDEESVAAHYKPIRRKLAAKGRAVRKAKEDCGLEAAQALVMHTEHRAIQIMPTTPQGFAEKIRFLLDLEEQAPRPGDIFDVFLEELAEREFAPE